LKEIYGWGFIGILSLNLTVNISIAIIEIATNLKK
jgi:hypothetical protein